MNFASPFWGECLGTMVLIVLGNGVVAGTLLNRSKAQGAGWISITAGWALAVFAGVAVATSMGDSDAHLNPAVTVASVLMTGNPSRLLTYIPAQLLGAFLGAVLVWMHYKPHWAATESADLKFACFATSPAISSPFWNFFSEALGTFILVLVASALFSKANCAWRSGSGSRTCAGRRGRVGYWSLAWWKYRIRHQSCARFRAAPCSQSLAHSG